MIASANRHNQTSILFFSYPTKPRTSSIILYYIYLLKSTVFLKYLKYFIFIIIIIILYFCLLFFFSSRLLPSHRPVLQPVLRFIGSVPSNDTISAPHPHRPVRNSHAFSFSLFFLLSSLLSSLYIFRLTQIMLQQISVLCDCTSTLCRSPGKLRAQ